jgi:hypothetical protein
MDGFAAQDRRNRSQIEFCIDAFAEETGYVPADASPVRAAGDLSPSLERLVRSLSAGAGWRAWLEGSRGWFVRGTLGDSSDNPLDQPTVCLIFHDHDARAVAGGLWRRGAPAHWDLLQLFSGHEVQ